MSATAGGDGLEFDKRMRNIFEEIEWIKKDGSDLGEEGGFKGGHGEELYQPKEEPGFTMEDVPETLRPLSLLLESI